jgi:hypothetical protein
LSVERGKKLREFCARAAAVGSVAAAVSGIFVVPLAFFGGSASETDLTAPPLIEKQSVRVDAIPVALPPHWQRPRAVPAPSVAERAGSATDHGIPTADRPRSSAARSARLQRARPLARRNKTTQPVKPAPAPVKTETRPAEPPHATLASASSGAHIPRAPAAVRHTSTEPIATPSQKKPRRHGNSKKASSANADAGKNESGAARPTASTAVGPKPTARNKAHEPKKPTPPKAVAKPAPVAAPAPPAPTETPVGRPAAAAGDAGAAAGAGNGNAGGNGNSGANGNGGNAEPANGSGNGNGNGGGGRGNDAGDASGQADGKAKHEKR